MSSATRRLIKRTLLLVIIFYILGGLALYFFQDNLIFHPKALSKDHKFSFGQPYEEINLPHGNNNLNIVKFKPSVPRKGIVLFFHGNMENVEHYGKYPSLITQHGHEIWMIDYPGFGKTTGKRTEKNMYDQADLMYQLAIKEIKADSIIIYGKSLGTGIASHLASINNCRQLVLETPYYDVKELAKFHFPVYSIFPLARYSFPNNLHLKKVQVPVTIFHGTNDKVVPYSHGKRLADENKEIQLITIEKGSHNDLSEYDLFLNRLEMLLK